MSDRIRFTALMTLWIVTGYFSIGVFAASVVAPSASPTPKSEFVTMMLVGFSLVAALTALHRGWHRLFPIIPLLVMLYSFAVIHHLDKPFQSQ